MSAAARVSASERGQCLLCGKLRHVVEATEDEFVTWDLCKGCGLAFGELAAQVAGRLTLVVTGPTAAAVEVLEGQLHLDDATEDEEPEEVLAGLQLGAVLAAFRTGNWDDVDTMWIADAVQHYADGFRGDELQVLRAILRRRA